MKNNKRNVDENIEASDGAKKKIKSFAWSAKSIVLLCVYIAVVIALAVGNGIYGVHAGEIKSHLVGSGITVDSDKAQAALAKGDELVQKIASEGIVLLENKNGTLPLAVRANEKYRVNLFGVGSTDDGFAYSGVGSGASTIIAEDIEENGTVKFKRNRVTLTEGLEAAGFEVNRKLLDEYKGGNPAKSFYTGGSAALEAAKPFSATAIVTVSRETGENVSTQELKDPKLDGLTLTENERAMIDYVEQNYETVIVLLNVANTMEMDFLKEPGIDAALLVGFAGQSGTKSIGKALSGAVNPSGKTSNTAPYDTTSDPTYVNAVRSQGGNNQIFYAEDIYVGYKWYETANAVGYFDEEENTYGKGYEAVVQYPFGYGLSYTDFSWTLKDVKIKTGDEEEKSVLEDGNITDNVIRHRNTSVSVTVSVTNTGSAAGKDVVQVYYQAPYYDGEIEKSHINLVGFAKTGEIEKNGTEDVTVTFDVYDMASYDCYDRNGNGVRGWELDPGDYKIKIMDSAHTPSAISDITLNVPEFGTASARRGYIYRFDPESKGYVKNRFTGEDAEAGMPIDGNRNAEDNKRVTYLSRADFKGTFPKEKPENLNKNDIAAANAYYYRGYDDAEKAGTLEMPVTGRTDGDMLYLYTLVGGKKASESDLKRTGAEIVPNETLIMELGSDYKSPKWDTLLSQLTTGEISDMVAAAGFGTIAAESIGKPKFVDFDGPSGFNRKMASLLEANSFAWTAFPSNSVLACTWNTRLAYEMGFNEGDEAPVMGGINGWYAPTVNLHRSPYNTRNYEAYSEDGVLSGYMGASLIKGAKNNGLTCYLKHLALSEPGYNPNYLNTWLTEQNLRENYLKAFEICVKDGGANAVMSAFNSVGAVSACNSYALLTQVLRNEWGFRGAVVTDYNFGDVNNQVRSGNDLHLLPPQNSKQNWLDKFSSADVTVGKTAVKNAVYSYCNTYYTAKSYNPDADMGMGKMSEKFNWVTLLLVILDILCATAIGYGVFRIFVPFKRHIKKNKTQES